MVNAVQGEVGARDRLLNVAEVATALHVSVPSVRLWIRQGRFPVIRIGGRVLMDPKDLRAVIDAARVPAMIPTQSAVARQTDYARGHDSDEVGDGTGTKDRPHGKRSTRA